MGRLYFKATQEEDLTSFKSFIEEFTGEKRYVLMIVGRPAVKRIIVRPVVTSRLDTAILEFDNVQSPEIVDAIKSLWKDKVLYLEDFSFEDEK